MNSICINIPFVIVHTPVCTCYFALMNHTFNSNHYVLLCSSMCPSHYMAVSYNLVPFSLQMTSMVDLLEKLADPDNDNEEDDDIAAI